MSTLPSLRAAGSLLAASYAFAGVLVRLDMILGVTGKPEAQTFAVGVVYVYATLRRAQDA